MTTPDPINAKAWSPSLYGTHGHFVHSKQHTSAIIELLDPQPTDRIFDLGCGDGKLTKRLVTDYNVRSVVGVDASAPMIEAAQVECKEQVESGRIIFEVLDGFDVETSKWVGEGFDKVFSNAALHWMKRDPVAVIRGAHKVLKSGGSFIAEFGGHGNIACVHAALIAALKRRNVPNAENLMLFFPTTNHYAKLLDPYFTPTHLEIIPRPTLLPTDLNGWLSSFATHFLEAVPESDRENVRSEVIEECQPVLCDDEGRWWLDYVRIRVIAIKK
ncbi:uncharacterized protein SPPG_04401 [Spizellomyces punctatus DAOM BR117]|uniref:Methyltransferase domain-containing protein n=1 Tax=Spizellomyces punctatus (strain DAOM BR117) TaxID=645134 RepID=A0A0L0HG89_SPIPD|nr:uncharacterized protein SPPG_04401 [Spizellomyces punctatus DAOM BR117]KND00057.1 hypothetical protein SPPG_04401 [Spizellomyces punctatus DAOM BR117]|eukprot:XP_016608096.1 hypothetical protein SPPG_04401 [Spizellomyces punctatus DAOM BR117]